MYVVENFITKVTGIRAAGLRFKHHVHHGLVRIIVWCLLHIMWYAAWPCSLLNVTEEMLCHSKETWSVCH